MERIKPGMKLTKNILKRIYAYEISYPGFAETALSKLEQVGCSRAREYYNAWVQNYELERDAMLRRVAAWYEKQKFCSREVMWLRTRREAEPVTTDLHKKSDGELLRLLRNLRASNG